LIKPKTVNRDEFKYIESIDTSESLSQRNEDKRAQAGAVVLKPHEREIADRKIEELDTLVTSLTEDKDDLDESRYFTTVNTPDADFSVLNPKQMETLSEKVSSVVSLGRFAALPVDLTMYIQSLLSPTVTAHTKNGLFPPDENTLELTESIGDAKSALRASKLLLETMIEGRDDYRMRREEIVDIIIDLIKLIKDACVGPIIRSRRSGESHELFNAASGYRSELQMVLRLCGSVLARFATLIGKYNLSDRALNTLEYLTLELLVEQNSENEKDSVFTIKKFELFRQKAMDVLAQIFARYPEQRTSILSGIFSNLEKLPDKKASARQFVSAREVPIMTISALFMRFVQVVATNPAGSTSPNMNESVGEEDASDYEPGTSTTKAKRRNQHNSAPALIAQQLVANANNTANTIATSLCERASNTSKSGDKPFRNLLDLFIDDFCNVLGSPQWPAAVTLLQLLLVRMQAILQDDQGAKHSVVDKDMALTAFARIGCGVIDFRDGLKKMKQRLDISQSDLSAKLDRLANDAMSDDLKEGVNDVDVLAFDGPYRMVLESLVDYLDLRPAQEDPHLQAVRGYHVSSWLSLVAKTFPEKDDNEPPPAIQEVRQHLDRMIMDPKWLSQKL
jgi:cohesin loading factor subunit SCC2